LISELRLSQLAALLLVISAGAYVGLAVVHEEVRGVGFDVALSVVSRARTKPRPEPGRAGAR
jgi:hypothetical protein